MTNHKISFARCLQAIFLLAALPLQAQWSVAHLSEARERPYPVVSGHYALFVTGPTTGGGVSNKVDIYDANTGTWTVHTLPYYDGNTNPNSPVVAKDDRVFFAGDLNQIHIFNSTDNSWTTAPLFEPRRFISVGVAGDYVVFAGGLTLSNTASSTVDLFNVKTNNWEVAELSEARGYIAIAGVGNKIIMAGGFSSSALSDRIDILNTDTWVTSTATLVEKRGLIEAVSVGNKVLLAGGGEFDFIYYNQVDIYDDGTETWSSTTLAQNQFAGQLHGAVVGTKAYFQGGDNQSIMDVYDASTGIWSTIATPTNHVIGAFTAYGNKLYLAGGVNDFAGIVEVFDCVTEVWDTLGFLSSPRYWVSPAAVGNTLLLAGGYDDGYSDVVDIYTGISSSTLSLPTKQLQSPYPNPAQSFVHIELPEGASVLQLFDVQGRLIHAESVVHLQELIMNVESMVPGIYLVAVEGAGAVYWGKIVVE